MWVSNDLTTIQHQPPKHGTATVHSGRSCSCGGWKRSVHSQRSTTELHNERTTFFTVAKGGTDPETSTRLFYSFLVLFLMSTTTEEKFIYIEPSPRASPNQAVRDTLAKMLLSLCCKHVGGKLTFVLQ